MVKSRSAGHRWNGQTPSDRVPSRRGYQSDLSEHLPINFCVVRQIHRTEIKSISILGPIIDIM